MTLKEILQLKIIRDNVQIMEFIPTAEGLGTLETICDVIRQYGIVKEDALLNKGLNLEHLNYDVIEIWATRHKFKLCIVIKKPTK